MSPYERFRLQVECAQRHKELLEDAHQLRRAGRIREARKLEESAREVSERLRALDEHPPADAQYPKR
ncbi:MAG TPA: hypothetical protein VMF89_13290 [Polyangiales bacterium]|nr:hypothetical protein [Polyangiales bacterium]